MSEFIIKNYEHFNRSMGIHIKSKKHYNEEMRKRGFVSQEEGNRIAESAKHKMHKDYKPSDKCRELLKAAEEQSDRHGNIKHPSGQLIEGLRDLGVKAPRRTHNRGNEGGFDSGESR